MSMGDWAWLAVASVFSLSCATMAMSMAYAVRREYGGRLDR